MRREFRWLQPGHLRPLLQDRVDGLRVKRPLGNRAPASDPLKALPLSILAAAIRAFSASTGRPVR